MKATNGFQVWAAAASEIYDGSIVIHVSDSNTYPHGKRTTLEGDIACTFYFANGEYWIRPSEVIETIEEWNMLVKLADYCDAAITGIFTGEGAKAWDSYCAMVKLISDNLDDEDKLI